MRCVTTQLVHVTPTVIFLILRESLYPYFVDILIVMLEVVYNGRMVKC